MKRDKIFEGTAARASDFEFNEEVAEVFDDMLVRSVPFYVEQQMVIKELARHFYVPGTTVDDLGCSTGTTLISIARELREDAARLIGYDNSWPMVEKAKRRIQEQGLSGNIEIHCRDITDEQFALSNSSVVTMCWTLQFVRPLRRDHLIRRIYQGLVDGGALIVTEKVLTNSSEMNRVFVELYHDFKKRNGYSNEEIARKREALENVLVPYRADENVALFRRAGFQIVESFFQWYNFAGFLCVKRL